MKDVVFKLINLAIVLAIIICYVVLPWENVFGENCGYVFLLMISIEIAVFAVLRTYLMNRGLLTH